MVSILSSPIELPSGLVLPNRLVKAAMAEGMATDSDPTDKHISAYTTWGSGGWGSIMTGNVEVSPVYRESNDTVLAKPSPSPTTLSAWKSWSHATQREGSPGIVQLVHPGRQSPPKAGDRPFSAPAIAPSAIPLNIGDGLLERVLAKVVFGTPRAMTVAEIKEVTEQFAYAAKMSYEAGFKAVELHAAHGYLLSTFLSPKFNTRTDDYGGSAAKRARIVVETIRAVRKVVPASFAVGLKLNSADVAGAENMEESLEQVGLIAAEQIDFLEISGGTYENPTMSTGNVKSKRTKDREAFFLDYAQAVRERHPNLILMVTGGFRSREGMENALKSGACDLIGVARPAAIWPHWPKETLLNEKVKDEEAIQSLDPVRPHWLLRMIPLRLINIGADSLYYAKQIGVIARGGIPVPPPKY
ncbi:NADH:flavin oxidoreductase/NADH oxidase-like protein [Dendryphion nanum]|uniref:NADH:flavin oxidoreductase/NADH oxidase-like protein n=1 Tax=Dendryphion nanum TaxID=256645 RepID=A0A9P9DQH4_9PLEO|nr:NADH:flavin oxidoreductase/NADH oxidase-like protein [Dendryphion nanum]